MKTMTEQDETKELIKRIKNLESKIVKLEKESRMGLEDQLSFGVIISLVVFILALPPDEVTSFFQNFVGLSFDTASEIAQGVRNTGLLCLVLASATRYYGAVSGQRVSKRFRYLSLQCLTAAWNFFLLIFVMFASFDASFMLGPLSVPVASIILIAVYSIMIFFENRILKFYASREFIFKKDVNPIVSKVFLLVTAGYYFAFVVEFIAIIKGMSFSSERFVAMWLLLPLLIILLRVIAERRKKAKKRITRERKSEKKA